MRARNASRDFERQTNAKDISLLRCACARQPQSLKSTLKARRKIPRVHFEIVSPGGFFSPWRRTNLANQHTLQEHLVVSNLSLWIYSQSRAQNGNLNGNLGVERKGKRKFIIGNLLVTLSVIDFHAFLYKYLSSRCHRRPMINRDYTVIDCWIREMTSMNK